MRPTEARFSEMPGPKVWNQWWGSTQTTRMKGIVQYSMSPMRQRAMKHVFSNWLFNGYRRLSGQVGYWIVPFAIGYGTYAWAKKYDTYLNSKAAHVQGHAH